MMDRGMEDTLRETVVSLYNEKNWRGIIKVGEKTEDTVTRNMLWVWPSEKDLEFIKQNLEKYNCNTLVSVGCGCGLFEWIFQEFSKMPVIGYEINMEWWLSKYSNPLFIDIQERKLPLTENKLGENVGLLFCYFNDNLAFKEYVKAYKGNVVIIIGPEEEKGVHTAPKPFEADFGTFEWTMVTSQQVRNTTNHIAVYVRDSAIG